jgi:hypothetical protein
LDSQEMAGAGDVTARGAMEAGEGGGGSAASRLSRGAEVKGVGGDHAAFPKAKAVGEVGPPYSLESCGAGMGGGSAVGRRKNPWEHEGEVGGWGEFF